MSLPQNPHAALNATRRTNELRELIDGSKEGKLVDLIVIGGGITGVGIALDAASRGLSTVLLEKHDLAFGTSRWSSKLAHGGLRYLTKLEVGIAHHSAVERGILMSTNAPHLVHALPQVTALASDTNLLQKAAVRAGYIAGDMLRITAGTSHRVLPRSRFASKKRTLQMCPRVLQEKLLGAWVNYDGQMVDDARLVTAVARTAAEKGAKVLTYCDVRKATGTSVEVVDTLGEEAFTLNAKAVVNATGVWAQSMDQSIKVRPASGTHLVFDAETFGNPTGALTIPLEGSISRYLFILPEQHGRCYVGLTDNDAPGEIPDVPPTPEEDIDFILDGINRALDVKVTRDDVIGAYTGLRPLIQQDDSSSTADLSRRHALVDADNGLISIVGGKFTEYRLMAEQTVDHVIQTRGLSAQPCRTKNLPLVGAPTHPVYGHVSENELAGIPACVVRRFGNEAPAVVQTCSVERPTELLRGCPDVTRAEIAYAITNEGALTVDDVLERRTRIGLVERDREKVIDEVTEIFEAVSA